MSNPRRSSLGGAMDQFRLARASTIIGITMLMGWVIPFIGMPLGTTGLVLGLIGWQSSRRDLAQTGLFLNALGLLLTGLNLGVSLYFFMSGKLDSFNLFQR